MVSKKDLEPKKLLWLLMLIAIFIPFTSGGIVSSQIKSTASSPREKFRIVVKLKAEIAFQAESSLSQTEMEITSASSKNMYSIFHKYKIKRMEPVYKDVIRWKKRTGKTESDYTTQIRQKFSRRTRRYHGTSEIPDLSRTYIVEPDVNSKQELERMVELLKKDSSFEYVAPDRLVKLQMTPNDPYFLSKGSWGQSYEDLYGLKQIACPAAWDVSSGSGVIVAVVDTGIDKNHPDITANVWTNSKEIPDNGIDDDGNGYIDDTEGWNFTDDTNNPVDDYGHGTHVAGTIAAQGNNGTGIIGVAPNAKVMNVKALTKDGGYDSLIGYAIHYAADNGADVINCSFGGPGSSPPLEEAIDYAYKLGAVVVVAAGNDAGADVRNYSPAGFHNVITVAALDNAGQVAGFSNIGNGIDVAAPGVDILSLRASGTTMGTPVNDYYTRANGTSMATPHVAGLAALILSRNLEFSIDQVRQIICTSADDLFTSGFDRESGFGQINALKAVGMNDSLEVHMDGFGVGTSLTGLTPINGTVKGAKLSSYILEYGAGFSPNVWMVINQGSSPVDKGQLGVFDAAVVPDGVYVLRLTAKDNSSPQKVYTDYLEVTVNYLSIADPAPPAVPSVARVFKPGKIISINGTASGPSFQRFHLEWGEGMNPSEWFSIGFTLVSSGNSPIHDGLLASWNSGVFPGKAGYYQIRLLVDNAGFTSESRTIIYLEPDLLSDNWPQKFASSTLDNSVVPVKGSNGQSDLVVSLPNSFFGFASGFRRYSYDGLLKYSLDYNSGFSYQAAADNLDQQPGNEVVILKDEVIRVIKPDNTFYEFLPGNASLNYQQTPIVLQDLNGDSVPEILALGNDISNNRYLFAWNTKGSLISNNYPVQILDRGYSGRFPKTSVYFLAADFDHDGSKEIIVRQSDASRTSYLTILNSDGTPKNWAAVQPLFPNTVITFMAASDLDHDGHTEIVLVTTGIAGAGEDWEINGDYKVYVLADNGTVKPGWPVTICGFDALGIADMDRDSIDEIVVSGSYAPNGITITDIHVLKPDGRPMSKVWPFHGRQMRRFSIGDINGDGFPEILIYKDNLLRYTPDPSTNRFYCQAELLAINKEADIVKSWDFLGVDGDQPGVSAAPVLGDFNQDGNVDIAIKYDLISGGGTSGFIKNNVISVLTLDAPYNADNMDWPMSLFDANNSAVRVSKPKVVTETALRLDKSNYLLKKGFTQKVVVTATYSNGAEFDVSNSATYQIADPNIASVNETGTIEGLQPGSTTLTVSCGGKTATAQVAVVASVSSIKLNSNGYSIPQGTSARVIVTATYSDGRIQDVTNEVTYQIDKSDIARVDSVGKITGVTIGSAMLTVTYEGKNAYAWVSITPVPIKIGFALAPYNITVGSTKKATVMGSAADGTMRDFTVASLFEISDPQIVSINGSGEFVGLKPGTVTLTAKLLDLIATTQIVVTDPVVSAINLDSTSYSLPAGSTRSISVTATYMDNSTKDVTHDASYQLADTSIATVDSTGKIRGLTPGTTTLTVSYQGKTTSAPITVTQTFMTGIALDASSYSMPAGLTRNVTVIATYSDNTTKNVTSLAVYQVSNPDIATVDTSGLIKGMLPGNATLTVSFEGMTVRVPVVVEQPVINSIKLDSNTYNIPAGLTQNIIVTASYSDNSTKDVTGLASYRIADAGIATITGTGIIRGMIPGTTTLTVNVNDQMVTAQVVVSQPIVTAIGLDAPSYSLAANMTKSVAVLATYSDNTTQDVSRSAIYQMANPEIATIDTTGLITGLTSGTTTLTVSYQGKICTATIHVEQIILSTIKLNSNYYYIPLGLSGHVVVTAVYSDNSTKDITSAAGYQISDPGIATVDATGKIQSVAVGSTKLTVSYNGKTAVGQVYVEEPAPIAMKVNPDSFTMPLGLTKKITVIATYSDNSTKDVTNLVSYKFQDNTIAQVDATGTITGLKVGSTSFWIWLGSRIGVGAYYVTVTEPVATSLKLDANSYNISAGLTKNVLVNAVFSDNSTKDITSSASYQMANTGIATVDASGKITGLASGTTTLTVNYNGLTAVAQVIVGDAMGGDGYEPNDTMAAAYGIGNSITITPTIHNSSDVDYFKITIANVSNITFVLIPPSDKDYDLYLLDSLGNQIGVSTAGTGSIDQITKSLASGAYYIKVVGYRGAYSATPYTFKVTSN